MEGPFYQQTIEVMNNLITIIKANELEFIIMLNKNINVEEKNKQ